MDQNDVYNGKELFAYTLFGEGENEEEATIALLAYENHCRPESMDTFGFDRYLNQDFYQSREWRQFRDKIIVRDIGCDLAHPEHEIVDWVIRNGKPIRPRIIIHHLNPLTKEDVLGHTDALLNPENVVCVSDRTHKAIHYGDDTILKPVFAERRPGDTCPWRK